MEYLYQNHLVQIYFHPHKDVLVKKDIGSREMSYHKNDRRKLMAQAVDLCIQSVYPDRQPNTVDFFPYNGLLDNGIAIMRGKGFVVMEKDDFSQRAIMENKRENLECIVHEGWIRIYKAA